MNESNLEARVVAHSDTNNGEERPRWKVLLDAAHVALMEAVVIAPEESVPPVNRAISQVRAAAPHDFVQGYIPVHLCAWCFLPRMEHIGRSAQ